jgi:hypothetical protein
VKVGKSAMVIGAYAGIILDVYFLNGTPQKINLTNNRFKFLGRFLITVLFFALEYLMTKSVDFSGMVHGDMLESSVIHTLPSSTLLMFMFSYLKVIFKKLNLVNI